MKIRVEDALQYHSTGRRGKVEVVPTKPCVTQRDLSLAYTPGVAEVCRAIDKNPDAVYEYTSKGNLVAVLSNGTAVLGLGNIGPLAGKPVMEGKGVLFKRFADIDVFDIEINAKTPEEIIAVAKALEPTFGGINLEDIKAPDCFTVEETLKESMNIPVFHDDQHGTAIISSAALLNALEIAKKDISKVKIVVNGAGAAAIACTKLYLKLGAKLENVTMCDSKGVIYKGRPNDMNRYKEQFAQDTKARTLSQAFAGADVFVGLSVANVVTKDMVRSMAPDPIIFAMANPDPEIAYEDAVEARPDAIMATGRSDYPNQVNNVLGFPFIFRGALDVRARNINDEMKIAAVNALARLAKEQVPDSVKVAYGGVDLRFGKDYIIPKPFDPRVITWVAPAVAKAAIETKVARVQIEDWDKYVFQLEERMGITRSVVRTAITKSQGSGMRIVFPEGEEAKVLQAAQIIIDEEIAKPVLLGRRAQIELKAHEMKIDMEGIEVIDPTKFEKREEYVDAFFKMRQRKGLTRAEAARNIERPNYLGAMMVHVGDADGLVSGLTQSYPNTIRPALQVIGMAEKRTRVAGLYIVMTKRDTFFFADTTVNVDPTAEDLAEIAIMTSEVVKRFNIVPRVAMLSFSNFGNTRLPQSIKVQQAVTIARRLDPTLVIDGEVQADVALSPDVLEEVYPFSNLKNGANTLIFPDLNAGNIAYKLMGKIGGAALLGPILMGMKKPVHVLQQGCDVNAIVNIAAVCAVEAIDRIKNGSR
ncbi:MAG TPA: NADP-dependent malic enzyme [Candidatus Kryptobacter bacterium]|nr:MAG: NADP-dependent malic enzyme [Ignavibacteriae bacterium 37-53-5]HQT90993.1 NADP-dependent malic enzyme [Candidatus Kryptobacter bacterium]